MTMMRFDTLINQPADWMTGEGAVRDVVLTSRIRLARNLTSHLFPGWAKKAQRMALVEAIMPVVERLDHMEDGFSKSLEKLTALQKQVLVERHLISREQAARGDGSAAIINRVQDLSLLINEEDHLRIQGIGSGLCLEDCYARVSSVDENLQGDLDFSFDEELGYLTACPTNVGTGMRASVMMHLPALVLSEQIKPVINAANQHQYVVRGIYGEGTESLGNLFQLSNQSTLGESEQDIIKGLDRFTNDLVEAEENAREKLLETNEKSLLDHIGRAFGILKYAHTISSVEALNLLSLLRLGASIGVFSEKTYALCDALLMNLQPAHLQLYKDRDLEPDERDVIRAEIIRDQLQSLEEPVNFK